MSGKKFEFVVGEKDSFESADVLEREPLAKSLLSLVRGSSDSLIIALDDEWGSGKTFFLQLWSNMLKAEGVPVIYFSAFENDLSQDAFISLSSCLVEALNESDIATENAKFNVARKAARVGHIVGRSFLNIAIKSATAGVVDLVNSGGAVDAAIAQVGAETSKLLERAILDRAGYKEEITQFRDALIEARRSLQTPDANEPLVVIVDELDRCRPDFALDVLECLKHFFDADSLHFVLGVNVRALSSSVETVYGSKIDGAQYLSRFIDYRISFSPSKYSSQRNDLLKYAEHLWEQSKVLDAHSDVRENLLSVIVQVVLKRGGALRDISKLMSIVHLCLAVVDNKTLRLPPILGGLILLKYYEPKLFYKSMNGELSFRDVKDFFGFRDGETDYSSEEGKSLLWMHQCWAVFSGGPVEESTRKRLGESMLRYDVFKERELVPIMARNVVDRFWQS